MTTEFAHIADQFSGMDWERFGELAAVARASLPPDIPAKEVTRLIGSLQRGHAYGGEIIMSFSLRYQPVDLARMDDDILMRKVWDLGPKRLEVLNELLRAMAQKDLPIVTAGAIDVEALMRGFSEVVEE